MKIIPTRTLNPLPFNDLEPHRFEDLIRQLAYEFRRWKSLEATGRAGSDGGIDIRATELVPVDEERLEELEEDSITEAAFQERLWIFQCKREKALPPKRLRKVVEESLASLAGPPHGFILAVASDISKDARDAFREEMVARGVEEFLIWAKSELEDFLFQPNNDRLLFAYFGISLQPRRRSLSTSLRSDITKKKQLVVLIGEENPRDGRLVLLRDPTDDRYPEEPRMNDPLSRWRLCQAIHVKKPGYLAVVEHEYLAATTPDGHWDAIFSCDVMMDRAEGELSSANAWSVESAVARDRSAYEFWNEYIDEGDRAYLKISRLVPLDRILALDPHGDGFFPVPHILVEFSDANGPFSDLSGRRLKRAQEYGGKVNIDPSDDNRRRIFPDPLPSDTDPEPKQFDDTGDRLLPLSVATNERLAALQTKSTEQKGRLNLEEIADAPEAGGEQNRRKLLEFRQWRDSIAHPVFSAFVHELRSHGHRARVLIRSSESAAGSETIELRVTLNVLLHYRPSGHVRISVFQHSLGGWKLDISPAPESSSRHSSPVPGKQLAANPQTTKAELEAAVLDVLERLRGQFQ